MGLTLVSLFLIWDRIAPTPSTETSTDNMKGRAKFQPAMTSAFGKPIQWSSQMHVTSCFVILVCASVFLYLYISPLTAGWRGAQCLAQLLILPGRYMSEWKLDWPMVWEVYTVDKSLSFSTIQMVAWKDVIVVSNLFSQLFFTLCRNITGVYVNHTQSNRFEVFIGRTFLFSEGLAPRE